MRVFMTGATGSIGSFLVPELINAGHQMVGLSRSDAGADALTSAGAEVFRGDVNDLDRLHGTVRSGAVVTKSYQGPDAAGRSAREAAVLTALAGRLPVPPLIDPR
jgi:uncharacterized protein YbjT (DUF2867 family)